jgi:hypothetical protein
MVEVARADAQALGHVGLRQRIVPPEAAEALAEEQLGGHCGEGVKNRQKSQVIL